MRFTPEVLLDLEEQSKIRLSDERREKVASEMEAFLERVDAMKKTDTEGMEPLYHIFPTTNVFREDEVTNTNRREELLENAPDQKDGYFKVPVTLE